MVDIWPKGQLVELPLDDCWSELEARSVGRLVWCAGGRPHIVPINFHVAEGSVWVRTAAYTELAREAPGSRVTFEIDDIDDDTHSGLSVVVEGPCETVGHPSDLPEGIETWVVGTRSLVLRIEPLHVSGRRLRPT